MSDRVLRFKQIAQYPLKALADPSDAVLLQNGGLGGPYQTTTVYGVVSPILDPVVAELTASIAALQQTDSELAQTISGNYAALSEAIEQQGTTLQTAISNGYQYLLGQILANRSRTVWTFNGRPGDVVLTGADVFNAGAALRISPHLEGVPTTPFVADPNQSDTQIANTAFVQRAAIARLADFMGSHPITWTFNGRTGDVLLKAKDVWGVGGVLRQKPYVPTPSIANYSDRIATTKWVMWHLDDLSVEIDDLRAKVEQEIDESALATKAYVDTTFVTRQNSTLGGYATAPTPPLGTNNAQVATTAFVMNQIAESTAGVASFNGRTGNVVLESTDLGPFNLAPLDSPVFTGIPTAPTAVTGTSTDQLATTAYVMNEVQAIDAGVVTFNGRSGAVTLQSIDVAPFISGLAPLDSPTFTGTPQVPTADAGTATNQAASTGFVTTAIADALGQLDTGVASWNGRTGTVSLLANDISAVGGALLASPNFTGTPTVPTAAAGTATTQAASTAFVQQALTGLNLGVQSFNGRSGAVQLNESDMASTQMALRENYVDNSNFLINQRGYTSGTSLGTNSYGFDRWRTPTDASAQVFYTSGVEGVTVMGVIQQIIEGANFVSATYTLSWQGAAYGAVFVASEAPPTNETMWAPSPIQFVAQYGQNVIIKFQGSDMASGTLSRVKLELGSVATAWQATPYEVDLARCRRFYQFRQFGVGAGPCGNAALVVSWCPAMRTTPTVTCQLVATAFQGTPQYSVWTESAFWIGLFPQVTDWMISGTATASAEL